MVERFKAHVSRYVEQTTTIEVDAIDKADAAAQASNMVRSGAMLAWADGDHTILEVVYDVEPAAPARAVA